MHYRGPSGNTSGLRGKTTSTLPTNQPMVVEWFGQPTTVSPYAILECGWSSSGDGSTGVSLRFYADGRAEVWKAGLILSTYSIGGNRPDYFNPFHPATTQFGGGSTPQAPRTGYIQTVLIPFRDRELLVVSSLGGGFSHIFQDLNENEGGLTITDNAPFWFYVPAPNQANLRFAVLKYAATGTIFGIPSTWRNAPPLNLTQDPVHGVDAQIEVFQAKTVAGTLTPNVMNPGNPPTTNTPPLLPVQIRLVLDGGPDVTPFAYGARAHFDAQQGSTVAPTSGPVDLLPFTTGFDLDVSDTVGGTRASLSLMQPSAIESAGGAGIAWQCHRSLQVADEVGLILDGICEPTHWTDSFGYDDEGYDRNQDLVLEARDPWKLAEEMVFSDPVPLDGLTLADAYRLVASMIGLPSVYVSPAASGFILSDAGSVSGGNWNIMIDVGDKGSYWLDRLHQTYAATWFHGFRPNRVHPSDPPVLCLIDPADTDADYGLPVTPSVTLYRKVEEATVLSTVYRSLKRQVLEPETNDIWVIGCDPRSRKPIVVHLQTTDMATDADPSVPPESRSRNWLGFLRKYGWVDPTLTSDAACQHVATILAGRLPFAREIVEFECEFQPGIWRGDLVSLDRGEGDPLQVRIKAFRGSFEHVGTFGDATSPDGLWRPFRYIGELTPHVSPLDVTGSNVRTIGLNWNLCKAVSKQRLFAGGDQVSRRPIHSLTALP